MAKCVIEVLLWCKWSLSSFIANIPDNRVCIRLDKDFYVYLDGSNRITRIKASKIKKIEHVERKEVQGDAYIVGRVWLHHCLDTKMKFEDQKDFLKKYMFLVSFVRPCICKRGKHE